ncbi:dephospho-CoA kinase [Ornithinibacillus halotolerans]|uniref:Dephospho-CoA kinase n=1 Tax=Ornithinibacillus halotolerans TaxID=1274357 RepID=A0A916WB42_9BACI|nr:dephospho-CoA kinase [Ornithinibacillus halotolerans]GGA81833.1 dephospho-CoA kinase [Ornithinibacillus halotolerans]
MSLVIGLTGSIATGKSTVSSMLRQLHIPVVDADQIARVVVEPGEPALTEIVHVFGEDILQPDGTLDRKKLGSIIFKNEDKRKLLNSIIHPAIRKKMMEEKDTYLKQGESCVVLDIPLLFESKLTHLVDKVLVVAVEEDVQLERLMERDGSTKEEAQVRIDSQIPIKEKVKLADAVINNNGTIDKTYQQLKEILHVWGIDK